jgi:FtsZ-interacting cell division protein ZipA
MQPETVIAIVVAVLVIGALLAAVAWRSRRSQALRKRFGPEYEHVVETTGGQRQAERELREREDRREHLEIRPLPSETQARYAREWGDVQRRFVDDPEIAVQDAHALVTNVMRDRGYPMEDFEQRAADISVDHPEVVDDYRVATRITSDSAQGRADTESLRQAMVHFRALFERLLKSSSDAATEVR